MLYLATVQSAEASDGYYAGLRLPYTAGAARVVVRVTEHGPGRHAADFAMSYEDVLAMYPGQVAWTGIGHATYGNYVVVDHLDNYCSVYAHFDRLYVRGGQAVQQGERLGRSGNTGNSTGPHLHAAVFRKLNGACGPANAWTEVQMLFDEASRRELRAGDWIVSRNVLQIAPPAPVLDGVTSHSLTVSASVKPDGGRTFQVERRGGSGAWAPIVELAAGAFRYTDEGLSPGSTYCYRVHAVDERGDSRFSGSVCAVTLSTGGVAVTQTGVSMPAGIPGSPTYAGPASTSNPWPAGRESSALETSNMVSMDEGTADSPRSLSLNGEEAGADVSAWWPALVNGLWAWLGQE